MDVLNLTVFFSNTFTLINIVSFLKVHNLRASFNFLLISYKIFCLFTMQITTTVNVFNVFFFTFVFTRLSTFLNRSFFSFYSSSTVQASFSKCTPQQNSFNKSRLSFIFLTRWMQLSKIGRFTNQAICCLITNSPTSLRIKNY